MKNSIKKLLLFACIALAFFAFYETTFAALDVRTLWELRQDATAANVNGGGFNPANANFMTNLTTDSNTANTASPVVSSASYNFVAADVGAWIYIQSGTDWTRGWYQIASVASNKATLTAGVGTAIQPTWNTSYLPTAGYPAPLFSANTVAGIATVGTPTNGVFGIDYSQSTATISFVNGDGIIAVTTTNVTSVLTPFGINMTGNIFHVTAGTNCTQGWYEVVSVSGVTATMDRSLGTAAATCTGRVGGAISLNSTTTNQTDDNFFELGLATNGTGAMRFFLRKNSSTWTIQTTTIAATGGTLIPIIVEGYNALRGDAPTGTNRPVLSGVTGGAITFGTNWDVYNLITLGSAVGGLQIGASGKGINIKGINSNTTAARNGLTANSNTVLWNCEGVSYRGMGVGGGLQSVINGCYVHDSDIGIFSSSTTGGIFVMNNISAGNISAGLKTNTTAQTARSFWNNNTVYGSLAKMGTGFLIGVTGTTNPWITNNIFNGLVTGIVSPDVQSVGFANYNDFFNTTTTVSATAGGASDLTRYQLGQNGVLTDPAFTSATEITGATGEFVAGNSKLVDRTKDFTALGITASTNGVPNFFVYISAGTGITNAGMYVGITSVSTTFNTNDTLNLDTAQGTNTTQDKVYTIGLTRNFSIGTNLKALGFPGLFPGSGTTGYIDIGGVQRQESSGGSWTFAQ